MKKQSYNKEIENSRVIEMAKDVWFIEGYMSTDFFSMPPSSNIYILRDEDTILILDTGHDPYYRSLIRKIINHFKTQGANRVILMVTQGHFDHAFNNVIVEECGLPWRFLLPEPEINTINFKSDFLKDFENLKLYEDVWTTMFPLRGKSSVMNIGHRIAPALMEKMFHKLISKTFEGTPTLADKAEILRLKDRKKRKFGSVELEGWDVGRFFAVHDAAHTPGHISLYDPENKLLLCGDVTIEINPAFFYSSLSNLEDASRKFRIMAEEGYIVLLGDSHRSSHHFTRLMENLNMSPINKTQLQDFMVGKDEASAFLGTFEQYYHDLQKEVINAHSRAGTAPVADILEELISTKNTSIKLKNGLQWPAVPSRMDVLVAHVLKNAGVIPHNDGTRIVLPLVSN